MEYHYQAPSDDSGEFVPYTGELTDDDEGEDGHHGHHAGNTVAHVFALFSGSGDDVGDDDDVLDDVDEDDDD